MDVCGGSNMPVLHTPLSPHTQDASGKASVFLLPFYSLLSSLPINVQVCKFPETRSHAYSYKQIQNAQFRSTLNTEYSLSVC